MLPEGCLHRIKLLLKIIIPEEGSSSSTEFLKSWALYHQTRHPAFQLSRSTTDGLCVLLTGGSSKVKKCIQFLLSWWQEDRFPGVSLLLHCLNDCSHKDDGGTNLELPLIVPLLIANRGFRKEIKIICGAHQTLGEDHCL